MNKLRITTLQYPVQGITLYYKRIDFKKALVPRLYVYVGVDSKVKEMYSSAATIEFALRANNSQ